MPKITIGLITYNRPELLKRAVNSLLNQTYKDILIYIGNDYTRSKITYKSLNIKKSKKLKFLIIKKILEKEII
jgi:GT2 family glycosyltransferase